MIEISIFFFLLICEDQIYFDYKTNFYFIKYCRNRTVISQLMRFLFIFKKFTYLE